jgi:hypothetical protein
MQFSAKNITDALKKKDFPFFKGDYNLNLIGIRSSERDANTFNDVLVVLYQVNGKQHMHCFSITTDPGVYYRENPINVDGTAVLVPGHYPSCWQIGAHRGKYYALIQAGEMVVYRDDDNDAEINTDDDGKQTGLFGINLHRANEQYTSSQVDKWSAGCQVIADPIDFELLMALVKKSAQTYGDRLSYTLLAEDELS